MIKRIAICLLLFLCASSLAFTPHGKYDVYLLIGQSNMAGRGYLTEADLQGPVDGVYLLGDDDTPVEATHPFNRYSTIRKDIKMQQMGPGYSFAEEMKKHSRRPVLLVVNARGGSSIVEWAEGTHYFDEAVRRTRAAMKFGRLKGILWHQGCSDAGQRTDVYMDLLNDMVSALRSELNAPRVPFVAGELPYWRPSSAAFNEMIRTISDVIPHSGWVCAQGCGMRSDWHDPHFDRDGQIVLGRRYAEKLLEMAH